MIIIYRKYKDKIEKFTEVANINLAYSYCAKWNSYNDGFYFINEKER